MKVRVNNMYLVHYSDNLEMVEMYNMIRRIKMDAIIALGLKH